MLFSHGPNNAFLVPDSCRVTDRHGNRISADVTDDKIEKYAFSAIFRQCGSLFFSLFYIAG